MRLRLPATALAVAALAAVLLAGLPAAPPVAAQQAPASAEVEVRIVRDGYGVPHVYADTPEAVAYGAGLAIAQDRLFQMDVLRHVAKGRASQLFGPIPGFAESDAATRRLFYTDAERRAKLTRMSSRIQRMYAAYVDGVNAWIAEASSDPSKLPLEYTQLGIGRPAPWDVTDSLAIAEMLVETFGAGGGSEIAQANLYRFLTGKLGQQQGDAAFDDVRWINDPASPVSIPRGFRWESAPTFADELPAKQWRRDARIGLSDEARRPGEPATTTARPAIGTRAQAELVPAQPSSASQAQLADHLRGTEVLAQFFRFGSNAFVTGPDRTAGGGTLQLGGPQVGQFVPQIVAEFGLHAPAAGLDMTGLTFAGSGPAVLIGRTPFFAWTTTTGNSDGADVYVVQLGPEPETYVYEGRVERMDCRDEVITVKGAPSRTERVCRTRQGPVIATDTANGVAYALRRSWFDFEAGTIEGFFGANFVDDVREFATSINRLQSNHNMFYVDADGNYGYWHPGALPIRAAGTDVRLPQDGRFAATDWRRLRTAQELPHAVNFDRGWLANWNNKPAVSWDNGDAANYGAVFRSHLFDAMLAAEPQMTREKGNTINRVNGTTELEFAFFRDHIVRAGRASADAQVRAAAEALATWDARRHDADGDGRVDSEPGYSLWKGWRSLARSMAFADDLGTFSNRSSDSMLLHLLDGPRASLVKQHDWLGGEAVDVFLNRVMRANLDRLATEFGSADMATWRSSMPTQHYTRLNARFYDCEVARAGGATQGCDDRLPGNVRPLAYMNRGTYNHLVGFTPGARAGLPVLPETGASVEQRDGYVVEAESIISPGQSGHIDQLGRQSPHYEDQHELYASWTYKPMPVGEADVRTLGGDRVETRRYGLSLDPVTRLAGTDRIGTAVAASSASFPRATTVVLAAAGDYPDALAAGPLAAKLGSPLLLAGARLDAATRQELARLQATEAVLVGGSRAIAAGYEADLVAAGLTVRRIAGADRFATAAAVATEVGSGGQGGGVLVASGRGFADALGAGAVGAALGRPILLVEPGAVPAATKAALTELAPTESIVVGGRAAVSDAVAAELPNATRVAGDDRYATSAALAAFAESRGVSGPAFVATGTAFADGLVAGPVVGRARGALLLVDGHTGAGADPSYGHLGQRAQRYSTAVLFGGQGAIGQAAADRVQLAISQR